MARGHGPANPFRGHGRVPVPGVNPTSDPGATRIPRRARDPYGRRASSPGRAPLGIPGDLQGEIVMTTRTATARTVAARRCRRGARRRAQRLRGVRRGRHGPRSPVLRPRRAARSPSTPTTPPWRSSPPRATRRARSRSPAGSRGRSPSAMNPRSPGPCEDDRLVLRVKCSGVDRRLLGQAPHRGAPGRHREGRGRGRQRPRPGLPGLPSASARATAPSRVTDTTGPLELRTGDGSVRADVSSRDGDRTHTGDGSVRLELGAVPDLRRVPQRRRLRDHRAAPGHVPRVDPRPATAASTCPCPATRPAPRRCPPDTGDGKVTVRTANYPARVFVINRWENDSGQGG